MKSKGLTPPGKGLSVSMKSRPVVGRQWATVDRSRAERRRPSGGEWERTDDRRMERKSSPGRLCLKTSRCFVWQESRRGLRSPSCLHSRASRASQFPALESGRYFEEGGLGGGLVEIENESSTLLAPCSRGDLLEFRPGSGGKPIRHVADLDHSYKF